MKIDFEQVLKVFLGAFMMKKHLMNPIVFCLFMLLFFEIACDAVDIESERNLISKDKLLNRGKVIHDHFTLNSIPKCGTHFIMNCIYYMTNKRVDEGCDYVYQSDFHPNDYSHLLNQLKGVPYIHKTHVPFFPEMEEVFLSTASKWVLFIRDPRDALASLVFYLETFSGDHRDFMWVNSSIYDTLSFNEKLVAVMTGSCCTNYLKVFYAPIMNWKNSVYGITVRFEDLIGPHGGGTREKQLVAIEQMANYLNIQLSHEEIEAIAEYSYVDSPVQHALGHQYKRSQSGSWKYFFNESNEQLFYEIFEQEFIESGYKEDKETDSN